MTDATATQADRDAAANLSDAWKGIAADTDEVRRGEHDNWHVIQAFARHRIAHSGEAYRQGYDDSANGFPALFPSSGEGRSNEVLRSFVERVSRLMTDAEMDGNMDSDDAAQTLGDIIEMARATLSQSEGAK